MKILIEESVLQQALEALYLRRNQGVSETYNQMAEDAITALRTALDAVKKIEDQLATVTAERDELVAALKSILNISLMDKGQWAKAIETEAFGALAKLGADKGE